MRNFLRTGAGRKSSLRLAAGLFLLAATQTPALAGGDATRGAVLYQGCTDCHSLHENDIGPKHWGVFGRKAGSVPDYDYSPGMKSSGIVWNEVTLDKWLTNPQALVPGAKMFFSVRNPQDRADIIEYLKDKLR